MNRRTLSFLLGLALLLLAACQGSAPVCPPRAGTPQPLSFPAPTADPIYASGGSTTPVQMEIRGKAIPVDQVVQGPLCNGRWRGTVYVACDVQVLPWADAPTFLKDCDLSIEPGTVVYVAYHNDTPYFNGCSCHTGEFAEP
jgi:hypothetical protein